MSFPGASFWCSRPCWHQSRCPANSNNFWDGWRESHGLRNPSYTEQIFISQIIRTRANTWSNLSYILVGLYAIALSRHDRRQPATAASGYLVRTPVMSLTFGVACCVLGLSSGLFHASLTRIGRRLDVAAIYTPLLTLCGLRILGDGCQQRSSRTTLYFRAGFHC